MRTYLVSSPWIHICYLKTDEEADKDGFAQVDFECMVCGGVEHLEFELPSLEELRKYGRKGIPELREKRDDFERAHQHQDRIIRVLAFGGWVNG
jgi:hypothetical protein